MSSTQTPRKPKDFRPKERRARAGKSRSSPDRQTPAHGYFHEEGCEFVVTNPKTPRPFDNFLWNNAIFSNVQQTGVGYCDYQVGGTEAVQLLTGVGRICDFDVFGRDHLMSRLFYVRDRDTGEFWNVNGEPVWKQMESYECRHGLGYSILTTLTQGIRSQLRIFIPPGDDPVELWTLTLTNTTRAARRLSVFCYNQIQFKFKWGFDSYGDMIFRSALFSKEHNAVVATKHPHRRPHDHLTAFLTADLPMVAFDGTRDAFVGIYQTCRIPRPSFGGSVPTRPALPMPPLPPPNSTWISRVESHGPVTSSSGRQTPKPKSDRSAGNTSGVLSRPLRT